MESPIKPLRSSGASFSGNTAKTKGGGVYTGSFVTISNTTFMGNTVDSASASDVSGGGMHANNGLTGSGLTFTNNEAKCTGCSFTDGGGLYIYRASGTGDATVTLSTFDGNKAWFGGGIFSHTSVSLHLDQSVFRNHTCRGTGGGLDVYQLYGNHLLFENNSVVDSGGGIFMAFGTLDNSRFINNTSQNTTSVDAGGGAVFVNNTLTASNLLFDRNNGLRGIALYVKGGAVLKHATIARPTRGTGRAIDV